MIQRSKRAAGALIAEYAGALRHFSRNAWLFLAALGVQSLGVGILVTVFGIYVKTAGLSEAVVGDAEGSAAMATAAICLMVAPLIAVVGYRRLFICAALLFGVARIGQAGIPAAGAILAFGAMYGTGDGFMQAAPVSFLAENSQPAERSHLYTADLFIRVVAAMLGGVLGGLLPALFGVWLGHLDALRATAAFGGAMFLVSAVPLWLMRERLAHPRHAIRRYFETMRGFRSWRHVGRLFVPQVLISVGAGLIMPFVSLYLKEHLGASLGQVGLIQGASQLAMGIAALGAPWLGKKFGFVKATALAEAASLPFLAAIPFITNLWVAGIVFFLRSAFMNMSWPTWNRYTMEHVPSRERPVVAGMVSFSWAISWLAGSAIGGRLMAFSYTVPYGIATVLYASGALTTWLLLRKHQLPPDGVEIA
jgi:MFS family permease